MWPAGAAVAPATAFAFKPEQDEEELADEELASVLAELAAEEEEMAEFEWRLEADADCDEPLEGSLSRPEVGELFSSWPPSWSVKWALAAC